MLTETFVYIFTNEIFKTLASFGLLLSYWCKWSLAKAQNNKISWWVVIVLQVDLKSYWKKYIYKKKKPTNDWWPTVISESWKTKALQTIVMDTIYPGSMLPKQWILSGRRFHNICERIYVLQLLNGGGFTFYYHCHRNLVNYLFQPNISKRKSETNRNNWALRVMGSH